MSEEPQEPQTRAGAIEYGLILALITIAVITAWPHLFPDKPENRPVEVGDVSGSQAN